MSLGFGFDLLVDMFVFSVIDLAFILLVFMWAPLLRTALKRGA